MIKSDYSVEINFTDTYKKYKDEHIAIREAMCLKALYPAALGEIEDGDLFAGRVNYLEVGFSTQSQAGGFGYYHNPLNLLAALEQANLPVSQRDKLQDMLIFWNKEDTTYKIREMYPEYMSKALPSDDWEHVPQVAFPIYRMAGSFINYKKLLCLGIPGLKTEVDSYRRKAMKNNDDVKLYEGMMMVLDLFTDVCKYYSKQAKDKEAQTEDYKRKKELAGIAESLDRISVSKPQSFRDAIQLFWLYSMTASLVEFGRMDVYLGDFYANDVDNGCITEAEALSYVQSLWRLINHLKLAQVNGRVIIGGFGRPNVENADRFALLAMEATRTVKDTLPQLTLRFFEGSNPALMEKAMQVIGEGRTYPLLYNDDVNVPAVMNAFQLPKDEAEQYLPLGCGEYVIDHRLFDTPSGNINILKALEITLHNGFDPVNGKQAGIKTGDFDELKDFNDLFDSLKKQLKYYFEILADQEVIEYKVTGEIAPYLYISMLYDDCLERGKPIFAGGIKYLSGSLEIYGLVNTADSLAAIKKLVYEDKTLSKEMLLKILSSNFEGYEKERKLLMDCPKFGNDDDYADSILVELHNFICNCVRDQSKRVDLFSYLIVNINNAQNTTLARWTGASADGRKAGAPMANANNPESGFDKNGLTAMLNSILKPSPYIHAGSVQNIKFGKDAFDNSGDKVRAILKTYFKSGGSQAMITVIDRGILEKAIEEPEKYKEVFVRIGGFSARFVDLPRDVQREILNRTTY